MPKSIKHARNERVGKRLSSRGYIGVQSRVHRRRERRRPFLWRCTLCLGRFLHSTKGGVFHTHGVQLGGERDDEQVVRVRVTPGELVGAKGCHSTYTVTTTTTVTTITTVTTTTTVTTITTVTTTTTVTTVTADEQLELCRQLALAEQALHKQTLQNSITSAFSEQQTPRNSTMQSFLNLE